jgi:hypothetical protein
MHLPRRGPFRTNGVPMRYWVVWIGILWWCGLIWLLPWRASAAPLPVLSLRAQPVAGGADALAFAPDGQLWWLQREAGQLRSSEGHKLQLPAISPELLAFCPQGPVLVQRAGAGQLWLLDWRGQVRQRLPLLVPASVRLGRGRPTSGLITGVLAQDDQITVEWLHRDRQQVATCTGTAVLAPLQPGRHQGDTAWQVTRDSEGRLQVVIHRGKEPSWRRTVLGWPFAVEQILDAIALPQRQLVVLVAAPGGQRWLLRLDDHARALGMQALPVADAAIQPLQQLAYHPASGLAWLRTTTRGTTLHRSTP